MRVALIADIHGNLPALEAVLAAIESAGVDRIVCLGDVAATGPQPHQVVERLRALDCPTVMGNADAAPLQPLRPVQPATEDRQRIEEIDQWCAAQLSPDDLAYLGSFQPTITVPLGDGATLLCFHGSPRSNTEEIIATTPDAALAPMLAGHAALVFAGGHTHSQLLRRVGSAYLVNPGSVGLPFELTGDGARNPPWAEYAILAWRAGAVSIDLRRAPYDSGAVVRAALESGMPHAAWWVRDWR